MSDFEDRLREALADGAGNAPVADGLAHAARRRARGRRRATVAGGVAAVVAAAVLPVAIFASNNSGTSPPAPRGEDPVQATDTGWRIETWRDIELEVPTDWGYGNLSTWCLGGGKVPTPVVERPGMGTRSIGCSQPKRGYGVAFREGHLSGRSDEPPAKANPSRSHPDGAFVALRVFAHGFIEIAAPNKTLAERVYSTAHEVTGLDSNDCSPRLDDLAPFEGRRGMSVCRYDAQGWLQQSERLSAADTEAATAALESAPLAPDLGSAECLTGDGPFGRVVMVSDDLSRDVIFESECAHENVVAGGEEKQRLTEGVVYWAVSPGWAGGVEGSVPMPDRLRAYVPPDAIEESRADWHTIEHEGVLVDVPGDWERLDTPGCELDGPRYGPPGSDACGNEDESLTFYRLPFDPDYRPGLRPDRELGGWSGYVFAGDWAVYVLVEDRGRGERILESVRPKDRSSPPLR